MHSHIKMFREMYMLVNILFLQDGVLIYTFPLYNNIAVTNSLKKFQNKNINSLHSGQH